MIQRPEYGEGHHERICCYCGDLADTVDHVPSKVFLNKPYPDNLPVVPCCKKCNVNFSLDEEYVAVLFECVRRQTFDFNQLEREKVRKIIKHKPALLQTVMASVLKSYDGHYSIDPEDTRLSSVLIKLVGGHLRFEGLDQLFIHDGMKISFYQDIRSNREFYDRLHAPIFSNLLPEVGSRALRAFIKQESACGLWFEVQPDVYEYCVAPDNSEVRIIVHNYYGIRALIS